METSKLPRKSCDFCYRRKIKCDGQKPRCSNCNIYVVDCTYAAPSRRSRPKKSKASAKNEESNSTLQARVQRLEILVKQLSEDSRSDATVRSQAADTDHNDDSPRALDLPDLEQTLSLVHTFLKNFNVVLPLFHPDGLLSLIHDTYQVGPRHRDPVAWAAINVVLALARRHSSAGGSQTKDAVDYHLSRAQSVLPNLVQGGTLLLHIQVLVGMVILMQGVQDLQPSLVLIATAIRLAHKIGLHNRASSTHLDPVLERQRAHVFWLAYILDKDLSLRAKQPSVQQDDDIDIDLPYTPVDEYLLDDKAPTDDTSISNGFITATNGMAKMNYFVSRIQLAEIEGGVYDYVYSTRSQKRSPEERAHALGSLARAIGQWKTSIPPEFSGTESLHSVPVDKLWFFCSLNATSLLCTTCINQAHAWNSQWMSSLRSYGRDGTVPWLPPHWEALVDEGRDLLVLYGHLSVIDCWHFWITGCSYMTAMVLLTAHSMHKPEHEKMSFDKQLVSHGLKVLDNIVAETKDDGIRSFRSTCAELQEQAQRRRGQDAVMGNSGDMSLSYQTLS